MADPKIKIRRSATPNKVPSKDQLQLGELAINTYDGKLYLEQDQGGVGVGNTVIAVNPWGVGIGSTAYNTQFTAGKVGVGTTNAQYNLDVGGDINFTGNLYQDGSAFTSGVGIRTAGGTVGWAATIIDFRGPGVTTAYYSSATGIGTVYFQGGGGSGGGGNASVTVSDSAPSSPSNGDLWFKSDVGELYLWYTDGSSNQWVEASGGSNTVITSDTAPSSPQDGDLWWNSNTGELKVYYNDGNSSQWVDANSEGGFLQYWTQTNTNGTLGVTTTGYVGIGTTTATDALTVSGNVNVTGVSTFQNHVHLLDNDRLRLGGSAGTFDGLDIYHDGNSSYVDDSGSGNLQLRGNDRVILAKYTGENMVRAMADGSVDLFYDNSLKFQTTNTGASVTGDLAASGNVTGVAATFTGNVTVGGVLTYEDVKNVDAIGVVTARTGIKVLAGGANIVDGTTTDELNVTGVATAVQLNATTTNVSGVSTFAGNIDANADLDVDGHTELDNVNVVGIATIQQVKATTVNVTGVSTVTGGVKVGTAATICSEGNMTIDRPSAGIITATKFIGDGSDLTGVISGIGIGTAGGVVGYAATIVHFKGAGVTTAYYNAATGIGTVFFHSTAGGGGGNTNVTIQDAPPSSPSTGDLWWESDTGELKIYYNDGNSSQWVDTSGTDDAVFVSTTAPSNPVAADLWFNSETGDLMIYYTDANTSQWVSVNATNSERIWNTNSTGIHTSRSVGIGTTTVTDALTVVGATDLDGRLIVSGITTFGSHVYHGDNDRDIYGDGSDLQIFHNALDSHIDNNTGNLVLRTNVTSDVGGNIKLMPKSNENGIIVTHDAQVELYHNNTKRFSTTDGGAQVYGTVGAAQTALIVEGDARVTGIITVGTGSLKITDRDINMVGVITGANFKSGTTNVHNVGVEAAGINVLGADTPIGTGATVYNSGLIVGKKGAEFQGVVTATTFKGALDGNAGTATLATNAQGLTGTPNITVGALTANTGQFSGNVNVLGTLTYEDVKNVDSAGIATARQGLRITGGGLDVVGVSTFNNNIKLPDSDKAIFGTGEDLQIQHTGSSSQINETTGELYINTNKLHARDWASGNHYLQASVGAGVTAFFNGSKKLETTSSGIDVTGTGTFSSTVSVNSGNLDINDSIRHIGDTDTKIRFPAADTVTIETGGDERLRINSSGDVGIGVDPASGIKLHIKDTSSDGAIKLEGTGSTLGTWIALQNNDATANSYSMIQGADAGGQGTSEIKFINVNNSNNEGALTIGTRPSGGSMTERLRITSTGFVGINTNNPARRLHVEDGNSELALFKSTKSTGSYVNFKLGANGAELGMIGSGAEILSGGADAGDFGVRAVGDIRISTGGHAEKMCILSDGKTGIGTVTPNTLLHLFSTSQSYLRLETSSNSTYTGVSMRGNTGTDFQIWKQSSNQTAYGGANSGCIWQSEADHPICFFQASTQRMTINSSGNIAIGDGHSGSSNRAVSIRDVNCILELTTQGNTTSNYTQIGFKDETANNTSWIWRQPVSRTDYGGAESMNFWHSSTHADTSISFFTAGVNTPALKIVANGTTEFHRNNVYMAHSLTIGNNHSSPAYDINIDNNNNHSYIVLNASQSDGSKLSGIQFKSNNGNSQLWRNGTSSSSGYGGANATVIYSSDGDTNFYNAQTQTANISNTTDLWTFPNSPLFSGYGFAGNGTQTAGGVYAMKPSTTVINRGSDFDTTTGVFTCPVAGVYEVLGHANRRASYNLWWGIYVIHNGNTISASWWPPITGDGGSFSASHFTYSPLSISHMISCSANDTLSFCYHASYSAPTSGVSDNSWTIRWVQ